MKIELLKLNQKTEGGISWFKYYKVTGELSHGVEHTGVILTPAQTKEVIDWFGVLIAESRRTTPVEDNLNWLLQEAGATHIDIGPNPAEGGWYCFVYYPDGRNWWKRLWSNPPETVEGWGETPSDAVMDAARRVRP